MLGEPWRFRTRCATDSRPRLQAKQPAAGSDISETTAGARNYDNELFCWNRTFDWGILDKKHRHGSVAQLRCRLVF